MLEVVLEAVDRAVITVGRIIPPSWPRGLYNFGLAMSPSVAWSYEEQRSRRHMLYSTLALIPCVWFFSIGMNIFFSDFEGRLWADANSETINFQEDTSNLILYTFISPAYVAISLQIAMISSRYGESLRESVRPPARFAAIRSAVAIMLCLAIAVVLVAIYLSDVAMGPTGKTYWFNDRIGGQRVLNHAGVYYCLMIFSFLSILLFAALNYLSITLGTVRLANRLSKDDCKDLGAMRHVFYRFKQANVFGRWLVAVCMIHIFIWSRSPLVGTFNIHLAGGALILIFIFLTAVPATHVDRKTEAAAAACGTTREALGIVPTGIRPWVIVADSIVGACYVLIWKLDPVEWVLTLIPRTLA